MGCVMITCPVTGVAVSTGIETEQSTLDRAKAFMSRTVCRACGAEHVWSRTDAWICEFAPFESLPALDRTLVSVGTS
jgi:hypothetical protein